jgi:hypothetical protein
MFESKKIERAKDPAIVAGEREGELGAYGEKRKSRHGGKQDIKKQESVAESQKLRSEEISRIDSLHLRA